MQEREFKIKISAAGYEATIYRDMTEPRTRKFEDFDELVVWLRRECGLPEISWSDDINSNPVLQEAAGIRAGWMGDTP
ncbi:MAG: hypothetical protein WBK55_08090 [Alphaproteobacteria bacterium]